MSAVQVGADDGLVEGDQVRAQGWYCDPYGIHEDRWMSGGQPTKLVRDQGRESFDEPPSDGAPGPLAPAAGELPAALQAQPRQMWGAWTVWLPSLLTLALLGLTLLTGAFADVPSCLDTCHPMPWASVSTGAGIAAGLVTICLLPAGVRSPARRRRITLVCWDMFLSLAILLLLPHLLNR
jgi:hypothetical protein